MLGNVAAQTAVTTYHYDNLRTGWNQNETKLTATNFPNNFRLLETVMLDDQVDAQPLVVSSLNIAGGTHDVVYVVTNPTRFTPSTHRPALYWCKETSDHPFLLRV